MKSLYLPEYCQQISDYLAGGHSVEAWAGVNSVSADAVYDWKEKYPEFDYAMQEGLARRKDWVEKVLKDISTGEKGNASTAIFLAKNWAGMRDDHGVHLTSGASLTDLFNKANKA